jgi:chemotaxis methyl-accepting protein methylase
MLEMLHIQNTNMFRHPKYYAALRAERRKLQASSSKRQAASPTKPEPSSGSEVSSYKLQAPSGKRQA